MVQLAPKQKIIEFLNEEFSKIKVQKLQQQANKKLKTQYLTRHRYKVILISSYISTGIPNSYLMKLKSLIFF